jgi:Ca-activated chloride channel family protein
MSRRPPPRPARKNKMPSRRPVAQVHPGETRTGNTEQYKEHGVRQWEFADKDHLSTFSIDVDTASYTIARRKLNEGHLPPPASVRTEEFVNYFKYDYKAPGNIKTPFAVHMEAAPSPFEKKLHVLRVGIKGMEAKGKKRKAAHLTFLVDTSGSMSRPDKIGLHKRALRFLVDQLKPGDTVALCTYAGSVREVLAPTGMDQRAKIHSAIENLRSGGSTAMSSGLELAYKLAYKNFKGKSINRVIVCSDGDANVGRTKHGDMLKSIKHYAEEGVTLSTIGFGMGNYKDHRMEQLANKGNGNYFYIDTFSEAKRVFGKNLMGTLQVIAKDVKIQVDFNPKAVRKYRLIGYENRDIADKDFRNDKVDAGEIGAGHTVTALYEVEVTNPRAPMATVRIRWKRPQGVKAAEKAYPFSNSKLRSSFNKTSADFRRAVAAAALAENLRNSPFKESWTIEKAKQIAQTALSKESKEELELIELINKAARLMGK